jgi:integrase
MATIVKRGPYSFLVRIRRKGLPALAKTFETEKEAKAWARRQELKLEDRDVQDLTEARETTLAQALERYRDSVTVKKKSHRSELYRVGRILQHPIASRPLATLRADDIEGLMEDLAKAHIAKSKDGRDRKQRPASPATQRRYAALLSHLFSIATKRWRIEGLRNPVKEMELPSAGRSRKRRLEDGEEEKVLAALSVCRNRYIEPMARLAIETAMRQGELLALHWKDVRISGDTGTATLHDTKNSEDRIVPLSSRAVAILKEVKGNVPKIAGPVFPVSQAEVYSGWINACRRAGVVGLRFHDLRHEATSRLFELGLNRIEAASVTGHKTLQMLKDYTHLRAENLAKKITNAQRGSS